MMERVTEIIKSVVHSLFLEVKLYDWTFYMNLGMAGFAMRALMEGLEIIQECYSV